jgi:hypothetical protein
MTTSFATERQMAFIRNLVAERDVAPVDFAGMTVREASAQIEQLLATPKKSSVVRFSDVLSTLPKSKYALPYQLVAPVFTESNFDNDYLFVEVREYRGTTYMRKLHGSLGDFVRTRFTRDEEQSLFNILKENPVEYIQKFGEVFSCCGKCGASLTDEASRARLLGPDCARSLGVR